MNAATRSLAATLLLVAVASGPLHAWGQEGHRITAELAERHLSAAARRAVLEILDGEQLARVATWPDEIRSYPSWNCAQAYHYVTVPPGAEYPAEGLLEGDSVQALVYFTNLLRDAEADAESRRVALSFVVHLVGDIHQPLHNGRGCDRGGNSLRVDWFGDLVNFHSVWDSLLIESENLSFGEWADFLDRGRRGEGGEDETILASTPVDWVFESQGLLDDAYTCFTRADRCPCFCGDCDDGRSRFGGCAALGECSLMASGPVKMSYAYKTVNLEVVRQQLVRGGLRLAGLLDWVLDAEASPPPAFEAMAADIRALPNHDPGCFDDCRGSESISVPEPAPDPACETP